MMHRLTSALFATVLSCGLIAIPAEAATNPAPLPAPVPPVTATATTSPAAAASGSAVGGAASNAEDSRQGAVPPADYDPVRDLIQFVVPPPSMPSAPADSPADGSSGQAPGPTPTPTAPTAPTSPTSAPAQAPTPAPTDTNAAPAQPVPAEAPGSASAAADAENAQAQVPHDLWERIRRGFRIDDLEDSKAQARTKWYAAQPDYIGRMASRAGLYLFHIVEEIERRGMPTELALLPFVESAMQPEATSPAQAAGLWQFIPSTGKLYSLQQSAWKDDRRDIVESTRAALDYLQTLYAQFGDWRLALAAYNCGEGGVVRALSVNRARHRPLDYSSLPLPRETQWYVPKLQAIKNIVRDPARYGIALPSIRNEPYFVVVNRSRDIDVATAARLAEMPLDQFQALNPAFNRPVIVGAAAPNLLLPADRAETFSANLAAFESTGQPLASWTTYRLHPNETLEAVAKRVGLTEAQLREANRVPPRYRLVAGSTILIPRDESMEDIGADSLAGTFAMVPESGALRRVTYRVRRGDTLQSVAHRWGVQADDIVAWNGLHNSALFAGQRLSLTVAARPAVASARRTGGKAATRIAGARAAAAASAAAAAARR